MEETSIQIQQIPSIDVALRRSAGGHWPAERPQNSHRRRHWINSIIGLMEPRPRAPIITTLRLIAYNQRLMNNIN